ncbi:MAG: formyltransferase family protein [Candidatus Shapirobacteria bacterium]
MKEKLAIFISGGGTTMAEIIKACQSQEVPNTEIACIISSKADAGGIEKARKLYIPDKDIIVVDPKNFRNDQGKTDQDAFGNAILKELKQREVSIVTQNGWLPMTPENVIDFFPNSIFNQHPGPVPEFGGKGMYGLRVHAAVLYFNKETNQKNPWTEVIGQRVDKEYDKGIVIKSARVEILPNDTADDLQQRALPIEHRVQIEMLKDYATGNVKEVKRGIIILPGQEKILERVKLEAISLYPQG